MFVYVLPWLYTPCLRMFRFTEILSFHLSVLLGMGIRLRGRDQEWEEQGKRASAVQS